MARACVWETFLKFDNVLVKRDVILDDYKSIVRRFPKAKYAEDAREKIAVLTRMVTQDAAHAAAGVKLAESLPLRDRI